MGMVVLLAGVIHCNRNIFCCKDKTQLLTQSTAAWCLVQSIISFINIVVKNKIIIFLSYPFVVNQIYNNSVMLLLLYFKWTSWYSSFVSVLFTQDEFVLDRYD